MAARRVGTLYNTVHIKESTVLAAAPRIVSRSSPELAPHSVDGFGPTWSVAKCSFTAASSSWSLPSILSNANRSHSFSRRVVFNWVISPSASRSQFESRLIDSRRWPPFRPAPEGERCGPLRAVEAWWSRPVRVRWDAAQSRRGPASGIDWADVPVELARFVPAQRSPKVPRAGLSGPESAQFPRAPD